MKKIEFACQEYKEVMEGCECQFLSRDHFIKFCKARQKRNEQWTGKTSFLDKAFYSCTKCLTIKKIKRKKLVILPSSMLI